MRVAYYTLVQVVPDATRGERMNVGVIAWDDAGRVGAARFARKRQRLRALGLADASFLSEFQAWVEEALRLKSAPIFASPGHPEQPWSVAIMRAMSTEWAGMLQLTDPRPSRTTDVERLVQKVYDRAVYIAEPKLPSDERHQSIRQSVAVTLRTTLHQEFAGAPPLTVRVNQDLTGQLDSHRFDVVLYNHVARSVLVTPNLRDRRTNEVRRDLDAAAWSIQDVAQREPNITFGLVRSPHAAPAFLQRITALSQQLPVEPLSPNQVPTWARREAARAS